LFYVSFSVDVYQSWGKIIDTVLNNYGFNLISLRTYVFTQSVADVIGHCFGITSRANKVLVDGVSLVFIVSKEDGAEQLKLAAQDLADQFGSRNSTWSGIAATTSSTALADLTSVIVVRPCRVRKVYSPDRICVCRLPVYKTPPHWILAHVVSSSLTL
jgi:hypothetical protein